MNKVISGKRYNTNSSRLVCAGKTGDNYALLYVKRNGEPFLLDNIDMGAGEIKQISNSQAELFAKANNAYDEFVDAVAFAKGAKFKVTQYISAKAHKILRDFARDNELTLSEALDLIIVNSNDLRRTQEEKLKNVIEIMSQTYTNRANHIKSEYGIFDSEEE